MATSLLCIAIVLLSLHASNSYILLTANIEDVHAIAKQIAASPVGNQLDKIIRRASSIFSEQMNRPSGVPKFQQRTDEKLDEVNKEDGSDKNFEIWKPDPKTGLKLKGVTASSPDKEYSKIALRSRQSSDSETSDISSENKNNEVGRENQGEGVTQIDEDKQVERDDGVVGAKQVDKGNQVGRDHGVEGAKQVDKDKQVDKENQVEGENPVEEGTRVERRHQVDTDLVQLGKNASFYLKSIKEIFESV